MQNKHWATAAVLMLSLSAAGCGAAPSATADSAPAPVRLGNEDSRGVRTVTLSDEAARRLGVATQPVRAAQIGKIVEVTIPYSAVIYDRTGKTWTYLTPKNLTFLRAAITVDRIDGDAAYLDSGPQVGAQVVTRGAEELLGAEYEISSE